MKTVAFLPFALLLSSVALANAAHDKIASLTQAQRSALFVKLLAKEDAACSTVIRTFYRGSDNAGNAYWAIQCNTFKAYQVQVSPNAKGSTSLLDCAIAKALGINCFAKFQ